MPGYPRVAISEEEQRSLIPGESGCDEVGTHRCLRCGDESGIRHHYFWDDAEEGWKWVAACDGCGYDFDEGFISA